MHILVTGATGFIGTRLIERLLNEGQSVSAWVRNASKARARLPGAVSCSEYLTDLGSEGIDAVINLAGEPIADKRWTSERKAALRDSRIGLTRELVSFLNQSTNPPKVFLSGSAIGYYGSQPAAITLDENSAYSDGFTHQLCADWEDAAMELGSAGTRISMLRTGIVLGKRGGALSKMLLPFKLGLGGPIGDGQQIMSWIHIDDWINAALFILNNDGITGPVNLVSPNPVTNGIFAKSLAAAVNRPAIFRIPCCGLKIALGEMSELLCEGQKVVPKKLLDAGYKFSFIDLDSAFANIAQ